MRAGHSLAAVCSALCFARGAAADLDGDSHAVARSWARNGTVTRIAPRLLERSGERSLFLPRDALDPAVPGCTTVAVLGSVGTSFVLRLRARRGAPEESVPEASSAGVAELVRCGARKPELARLFVEMRSPRAVFEGVVATGLEPAPHVRELLTHRNAGMGVEFGVSAAALVAAPLAQRALAVEARARAEGALGVQRSVLQTGADGVGETVISLSAGCHRLHLLAEAPATRGARVDVDLDLAWSDGTLAASDRTESPDASVVVCVGQDRLGRLRFGGTLPRAALTLLDAHFALPAGIDGRWDAEVRAAIAEAVGLRDLHSLREGPVAEALGVIGHTDVSFAVEPGACYVAAVGRWGGASDGFSLATDVDGTLRLNRGSDAGGGTSLAFCAEEEEVATIQVESRGAGLAWLLALFQTSRSPLGLEHE